MRPSIYTRHHDQAQLIDLVQALVDPTLRLSACAALSGPCVFDWQETPAHRLMNGLVAYVNLQCLFCISCKRT